MKMKEAKMASLGNKIYSEEPSGKKDKFKSASRTLEVNKNNLKKDGKKNK